MRTAAERRELLKDVYEEARECTGCPLHTTRTTVVFGAGHADADLMFVGEAPGANEDRMGLPFVGQAGKLLEKLLGELGLARGDVFIANTLKCRPPDNRDPHPNEIEACQHYLRRQVDLIEPIVICTLGNFATKLLRADPTGISRLHGHEEVRLIGSRAVRLYPLYHPAAALYTPSTLETLRADFHRIPGLLAQGPPEQPDLDPIPEPEEVSAEEAATPNGAGDGGSSGTSGRVAAGGDRGSADASGRVVAGGDRGSAGTLGRVVAGGDRGSAGTLGRVAAGGDRGSAERQEAQPEVAAQLGLF